MTGSMIAAVLALFTYSPLGRTVGCLPSVNLAKAGGQQASAGVAPDQAAAHGRQGNFVGPVLLSTPRRYLPKESARNKLQGFVEVTCWVRSDGTTSDVSVVKSLRPDLDRIAVDEVRQYRFQPATLKGKAIAVSGFYIDVHFDH